MQRQELKIAKIGNSRGVRIPMGVLRRYAFTDTAIMIESVDGILLIPKRQTDVKMSWADTAKDMAASSEDWSDLDVTTADGLEGVPWKTDRVAEKGSTYCAQQKKPSRRRT